MSQELDNCANCRYWDTDDDAVGPEERRAGLGVCRIQSYPDEFDNHDAFVIVPDDLEDTAALVTAPEFFCNLYKVAS